MKHAAPTATALPEESDLMILVIMGFVSDGTAEGTELGSLDGLKLIDGLNDGIALGYSLGIEDGTELGE